MNQNSLYAIRPVDDNDLRHYGVLGMHWGIHRYRRRDGTLTRSGQKKADKLRSQYKSLTGKTMRKPSTRKTSAQSTQRKSSSSMTDEELRKAVSRLQMEKQYRTLLAESTPKTRGQKFIDAASNVLAESAKNAAKDVATQMMKSALNDMVNKANDKQKKK